MAKRSLKQSVAEALEIPGEVAINCARLIITGHKELRAENHQGIISYGPGKIVFKTASGQVEVLGEAMTLAALSGESLSIEGELMAVCLLEEGGAHEAR